MIPLHDATAAQRAPFGRLAAPLLALLLMITTPVGSAQSIELGGELSTVAGIDFDSDKTLRSLTKLTLEVSGEVGLGFFPDANFVAELTAEYDAAAGTGAVEIGEAYAQLFLGDFDLIVGQQTIAWGSTDGFNPVDVLNPKDLRRGLLGAEKLPVPMIRSIYNAAGGIKIDAVVIPAFRASRLPELPSQLPTGGLPPGVRIVGMDAPDVQMPSMTLDNVQFGARATFPLDVLDGGDASVSYVHGISTTPTFSVRLNPVASQQVTTDVTVQPVLTYTSYDLVGIDFSIAAFGTVFRGEAAYTITGDAEGRDPTIDNHSFQAVFGSEYTFDDGPTAGLQGLVDYMAADEGGDAAWNFSTILSLRYQAGTRTNLEALWLQNLTDGSGAVAPRIDYTFADGVKGEVGAAILYGPDGSQFGTLRDSSQLSLGLVYAF